MYCLKCDKKVNREHVFHGLHIQCFNQTFNLGETLDFANLRMRTSSDGKPSNQSPFERFNQSFFHGMYKKYSANLGGTDYILKVQQSNAPELPYVEYLSNKLAQYMNIDVPAYHLIAFQNSLPTFVTRNIMNDYPGGDLKHIYLFLKEKDNFSVEVLIKVIKRETNRLRDVYKFIEICLFDSLIGNHDRHGRNLAIILRKQKVLSPFYDNPSYLGIETQELLEAQHEPRGKIETKDTHEPMMTDYINEFKRLGYLKVVNKFHKNLTHSYSRMVAEIKNFRPLSINRKRAIIKLIERRAQELEDGV
jgi:hypothetical protein